MKTYKMGIGLLLTILSVVFITACDPEYTEPTTFAKPDASKVDFKYTMGATEFDVNFENTSTLDGIVKWDLGNGSKASGNTASTKYRLKGSYTVTMTVLTKGGSVEVTKVFEQTKTDYSLFNDPMTIALSGGAEVEEGKTWVLDSLEKGHFGVGPAGGTWPEWWAANPLQKTQGGCYDDKFTFKVEGFAAIMNNNGNNYVSQGASGQTYFTNPVGVDGSDVRVNYNPAPGTWEIKNEGGVNYLVLNAATPLFFGFYNGTKDNTFRIDELTDKSLKLSCIGFDNNRWYYNLIPDGYTRPKITYDFTVVAGAGANTYEASLTKVVIPTGMSITGVDYSFGDGTVVTGKAANETVSHTYLRKGVYKIDATVHTSDGDKVNSFTVTVENNHPTYVEYLLSAMVMYTDFGETQLAPVMADQAGGTASVAIVTNPDKSKYPNRSANSLYFSKTKVQWANAYMRLPDGYRFDLRQQHIFKVLVYGKAGDKVLLKLENTDKGGDAWQTGTADLIYTIQADNTWEIAEFNMDGVGVQPGSEGWKWWPEPVSYNIVTDDFYNHDWFNVVRIMINPGNDTDTFSVYLDDLAGPHVEGLK